MKEEWKDETDGIGNLLKYFFKWIILACGIFSTIALTIKLYQLLF